MIAPVRRRADTVARGSARLPGRVLPGSFYRRSTVSVAREVLGCLLCRREEGGLFTYGRIVETEAYEGEDDPACHASAGLTPRTRVLYGPPGRAYVYFTYGMHHLVNLVTRAEGSPAAVLIRALRPEAGLTPMGRRRGTDRPADLTSGPSRLCQAMAIDLAQNETGLRGPALWVCDDGRRPGKIGVGPRVGIRKGTERPWRFWVVGDPNVSKGRPGPGSRRTSRGTPS